jgi:hypothetical protein
VLNNIMRIYTNNNYRKIYEAHHGSIPVDENGKTYDVHHIDGNRSNNHISNLIALSIQDHYNLHYLQGDYNACKLIKLQRMCYTSQEISELNSKASKGKASVKDINGKVTRVSVNDPRILSGELVGSTKGKTVVKDNQGNILQVASNDPRILSGELVGSTKGLSLVKDNQGNILQVASNDHRILSGELVGINRGLKMKTSTCIHCGITGSGGNMVRYHHNNCDRNIISPRYNPDKKIPKKKEKPIFVDGVIYKSLTEASNKLKINLFTLSYRARAKTFKNIFYIKE